MKAIRFIIGIIIWATPLIILLLAQNPNINIKVVAFTVISVYVGIKSSNDVDLFHKWFKSKLK